MNLKITSASISSSLSSYAETAMLSVAPDAMVSASDFENLAPEDSIGKLAVTDLAPSKSQIAIELSHGQVPLHIAAKGTVEFVSDDVTADEFTAEVELSTLPIDREHKTKTTYLWTNIALPGSEDDTVTAHQILKDICRAVGLPCGRLDFPNYQVVGTFEADQKTAVQVAEMLVEPFNHFEFFQYYVQVSETDGLQVVGVDYSGNDPAYGFTPNNVYSIPNIKSAIRNRDRYMPDNQIGEQDILLIGGDYLIPPNYIITIDDSSKDDPRDPGVPVTNRDDPDTQDPEETYEVNVSDTFTDTQGDRDSGNYSEIKSDYEFKVRMTNFFSDKTSLEGITGDFFSLVTSSLIQGSPVYGRKFNLEILESRITKEEVTQFESGEAKQRITSNFTYEDIMSRVYAYGRVITGEAAKDALTYRTVLTEIFVGGVYPLTEVKTYLYYNELGYQDRTNTKEYAFFPGDRPAEEGELQAVGGGWYLRRDEWEQPSSLETIQNQIQFAANASALGRLPQGDGGPFEANYGVAQNFFKPQAQPATNTEETFFIENNSNPVKQDLAQYQLVNGKIFKPEDVLSPFGDLSNINSEYAKVDPHGSYTQQELLQRNAFVLSCPHMTYKGLMIVYNMAIRQRQLERAGAYWEETQGMALLDTNVSVGGVVKTYGSVGILTDLTHSIDAKQAITKYTQRRMIVPQAQGENA